MIKSDSLDYITLDSYEIKDIENFENNYYNHKNYLLSQNQNGGNIEKLEKNIVRLYNCYVLSKNQNQYKLSSKIKRKLNKKLDELNNDYLGGESWVNFALRNLASNEQIKEGIIINLDNQKQEIIDGITEALKYVVNDIDDNKIKYLKKILEGPDDNKEYKNWLNEQIKNWINNENNKNNIIEQIKSHVDNFIETPPSKIESEIETETETIQEKPLGDFIDGLVEYLKQKIATPEMIIKGINESIDNNKQKIIDSIIKALEKVICKINDNHIKMLQEIFKAPLEAPLNLKDDNKKYKNWFNGQIKNCINKKNNKDVIINQIKSHINNFINASLPKKEISTQEAQSGNFFDGIHNGIQHFIKLQAPPALVKA
jgi:methionine synthase II (cobalamin-independent)